MKNLLEVNANLDAVVWQLGRIAEALERLAPPIEADLIPDRPRGIEALVRKADKVRDESPERMMEREYEW